MLLEDIMDRLSTLGLGLIVKGQLPATPDIAIGVMEYGGAAPNTGFGFAGLQDEMPGVQIKARGVKNDYFTPRTVIQDIYKDLPKVQGTALLGTMYRMIKPVQTPFLFERDQSERCVFMVNFLCEKEFS